MSKFYFSDVVNVGDSFDDPNAEWGVFDQREMGLGLGMKPLIGKLTRKEAEAKAKEMNSGN